VDFNGKIMSKQLKNKRINSLVLEQIMRDVLDGMQNITRQAGRHGRPGSLQILGVDRSPLPPRDTANIIPFPLKTDKN
jgi:hypothetical protein